MSTSRGRNDELTACGKRGLAPGIACPADLPSQSFNLPTPLRMDCTARRHTHASRSCYACWTCQRAARRLGYICIGRREWIALRHDTHRTRSVARPTAGGEGPVCLTRRPGLLVGVIGLTT